MNAKLADTHIHLEQYEPKQVAHMLQEFRETDGEFVVAVSMNLESARRTERLAQQYPGLVRPAYGFHPEQPLPTAEEEEALFAWMEKRTGLTGMPAHDEQERGRTGSASPGMSAVGEVGLPYYSRLEAAGRGESLDEAGYVRLLERFVAFAARHDLPIVLHAVYEDTDTACGLLERYGIKRAHFHWFKGSPAVVERMIANGYFISFTPDILYEEEIRDLALRYPESLVMSETDGPWPFEGPFAGQGTHPSMTADVCLEWAKLRGLGESEARAVLLANAKRFYD